MQINIQRIKKSDWNESKNLSSSSPKECSPLHADIHYISNQYNLFTGRDLVLENVEMNRKNSQKCFKQVMVNDSKAPKFHSGTGIYTCIIC